MKLFVLLGRYGDITTLLPALRHEALQTGQPTKLVVAKQFANLLDGVSYVEPLVWDGPFEHVPHAKAWAAKQAGNVQVVDCSVYGSGVQASKDMHSFTSEIWRLSKCPVAYEQAELIFDKRDSRRETQLLASLRIAREGKPIVLFAGAGVSSPFAQAGELLERLKHQLSGYNVVDISNVKAERPYDLLALFERAQGLVATDSFPLHLAQACPKLNVAALLCDGPSSWHRSAWRPNHKIRCLYSEAMQRVDQIARAVTDPINREIFFTTTQGPAGDEPTKQRMARALEGRRAEFANGKWREFGFQPARDASSMRDRPMPFARDLFAQPASVCRDQDIIVVCNADIGLTPGMTGHLLEAIDKYGCAFAHRWDYHQALTKRIPANEADVRRARWYAGSDFFACTKAWWIKNGPLFPDMVFGREAWDMVMRNLMKRSCGGTGCELYLAIWHEKHKSFWEHAPRVPGNEHNRRLATQWLARYGGDWNDWQGPQKYRG